MNSLELALHSRRDILKMTSSAGASHVGSGLSVIDILAVLYSGAAGVQPSNVTDPDRDRVILSKGHAGAAMYAILANCGFFDRELLSTYCQNGSLLGGHVMHHHVPGVEFSSGSLGHGLPFGTGLALSALRAGRRFRVFVVMSDGELDEGTTWESALFAAHHRLENLTVVVDRNGLQSLRSTEKTLALEPLAEKFESFGWSVEEVDGHNHEQLHEAIVLQTTDRPRIVIANTTKGKGVSFMEDQVLWHYRPPSSEQLALALSELQVDGSQ